MKTQPIPTRFRAGSRALWLFFTLGSMVIPSAAYGHDFWLEAANYRPEPGDAAFFWLEVGEEFKGSPVARLDRRIERFWATGPQGLEVPLVGLQGRDPAAILRPTEEGIYQVAYLGRPQPHHLSEERFESYLREEGLDEMVRRRQEKGGEQKVIRERFVRCAKSLLQVGSAPRGTTTHPPADLPLDLQVDRSALSKERPLPVRLLFQGRPLKGALVTAIPKGEPTAAIRGRTREDGRVDLPLDRPGPWLVKSVHMEVAPLGSGADYLSWWASLTFEIDPGRIAEAKSR